MTLSSPHRSKQWLLFLFLLSIATAKLTLKKRILRDSLVSQRARRNSFKRYGRMLLGKFTHSKIISGADSLVPIKKVKNLESRDHLPPGRHLEANPWKEMKERRLRERKRRKMHVITLKTGATANPKWTRKSPHRRKRKSPVSRKLYRSKRRVVKRRSKSTKRSKKSKRSKRSKSKGTKLKERKKHRGRELSRKKKHHKKAIKKHHKKAKKHHKKDKKHHKKAIKKHKKAKKHHKKAKKAKKAKKKHKKAKKKHHKKAKKHHKRKLAGAPTGPKFSEKKEFRTLEVALEDIHDEQMRMEHILEKSKSKARMLRIRRRKPILL